MKTSTYRLEPDPWPESGDISAGDPADRARDLLLLGRLAESGPTRQLWIDVSGEQVVGIFGKRGTGKSYTLGVLLESLASGSGQSPISRLQTPRATLVFDIMDIFWSTALPLTEGSSAEIRRQYETMKRSGLHSASLNVDVWIPGGFERPTLDPAPIHSLHLSVQELELDDWAMLFNVDIFSEPRGMLIADLLSHVSTGYTRTDKSRAAPKRNWTFADLLDCLTSSADIAINFRPDTIRSIRQRLESYASLALFEDLGTSLTEILRPFRASILMLARVPDALKKVIVGVLMRRLLRERRDASFAQKRLDLDSRLSPEERSRLEKEVQEAVPRSWILLDEAHVLAGTEEASVARESLVKYAKEGRQYGLSLAVATQQPSALDSRLTSQIETLLVHQLTSPQDAAVATANSRSPLPTRIQVDGSVTDLAGLIRRLGQGVALVSSGNAPRLGRPCVVSVRSRITAHGGYEA